ncbi:TrmH family RNA methyltransferase [Enterococcus sp. LJL99]
MKEIMSNKNELVKEIKKLHKKKNRDSQKQFIIEGFHLIEEAVKANAAINWIFVSKNRNAEWLPWLEQQDNEKIIFASEEVIKSLSELPTSQGILAVVTMNEDQFSGDFEGSWLLLDNVQDPGNVGTMIRTADAAGFNGVVIGEGTADIYSTKVLRSMQGSNFHLPILRSNLSIVVDSFLTKNKPIYGTELNEEAVIYNTIPKQESFGLILGNEGQGVSKELLAKTTKNIYIPIKGQAESLNVAIAAGILMYQLK